jgi:hypothetical protein
VLDWRRSAYAPSAVNLFTELFEPLDRWRGVQVHLPAADDPWNGRPLVPVDAEVRDGEEA